MVPIDAKGAATPTRTNRRDEGVNDDLVPGTWSLLSVGVNDGEPRHLISNKLLGEFLINLVSSYCSSRS